MFLNFSHPLPLLIWISWVVLWNVSAPPSAAGAGKKPQSPAVPVCSAPTGGQVLRDVAVRQVSSKPFPLPGGGNIDLSSDIHAMLITALTATEVLAPADPDNDTPLCSPHIELRATVSTLEMNLQEYGMTIGFTPTRTHTPLTNVNGDARVRVGTLAMDFSLWRCNGSRCSAVAAASANQNTVDTELAFTINFGLITSGASLASHPSFNRLLRKIVQTGVKQLEGSSRISELPWHAVIRQSSPHAGAFLIDAGAQSRLSPNQRVIVYAVTPTTGVCDVFQAIAYARIERVDPVSSLAVIEQTLHAREVSEGDIVMLASP